MMFHTADDDPAGLIRRIRRLHLRAGRAVTAPMAGRYRSLFRGVGMAFEAVRAYTPGDDVKQIHWKVSARLGKPYVKEYREERERTVMVLVDVSASVRFGTVGRDKQSAAAETAAILAFNAVRNNDRVGALLYTDRVERHLRPRKDSGQVWRLIKTILTHPPQGTGTDMAAALTYLDRVCRRRVTAFVISDFLLTPGTPVVSREMRLLARKHDLVPVLVDDPGEYTLPAGGIVTVRDMENGRLLRLDSGKPDVRRNYTRYRQAIRQGILDQFRAARLDVIAVHTDRSAATALESYFRLRERRRR